MYVFTRIFMRPQSLQNLGSIKMLKFVGPLSYYPWTRVTVSMQDNMWTSLHTLASCEPESSPPFKLDFETEVFATENLELVA